MITSRCRGNRKYFKERASKIVDSGEGVSVQLTDFCSKMDELHNYLNRLRVY